MNRKGKRVFTVLIEDKKCPNCHHDRVFMAKNSVGAKCTRCKHDITN